MPAQVWNPFSKTFGPAPWGDDVPRGTDIQPGTFGPDPDPSGLLTPGAAARVSGEPEATGLSGAPTVWNPFNQQFMPAPWYEEPTAEPAPDLGIPEPGGVGFEDYFTSIMAGGANLVQATGWLTQQIGGGDVGEAIETLGSDAVDFWNDRLSPAAKEAMGESFIQKTDDGSGIFGYEWADPSLHAVGLAGAGSLMGTAAGMGVGAGLTKMLQVFANPFGRAALSEAARQTIGGLPTKAAVAAMGKLRVISSITGAAGFGLGEGLVSGASTGLSVRDSVMALPQETMEANERYQQILGSTDETMSELDRHKYAAETVANEAATQAGWQSGLTTSLLGAPMGAFFGRLIGRVGRLGTTLPRATAFGVGGEAAQEFLQSGAEAGFSAIARTEAGEEGIDTFTEMFNAAVGGGLAGGLMGGVVGGATFRSGQGGEQALPEPAAREGEGVTATSIPLQDSKAARNQTLIDAALPAVHAGAPQEAVLEVGHQVGSGELNVMQALARFRELREAAGESPLGQDVELEANQAATSELNEKPMPTRAQLVEGDYEKGPLAGESFGLPGFKVAIETPAGSTRRGQNSRGEPWEVTMGAHYGDVEGTVAADGEGLDIFVRPQPSPNAPIQIAHIIKKDTKGFNEHKLLAGFATQEEAVASLKDTYGAYADEVVGPIVELTSDAAQEWINTGDLTQPHPLAEMPEAKFKSFKGRPQSTMTPAGSAVETTLELVELDSLIASHTIGGQVNERAITALQRRDRGRAASQQLKQQYAGDLKPELLVEGVTLDTGPPVVGQDDQIEGGNLRYGVLELLYNQHDKYGKGQRGYKEYLRTRAADLGLHKDQIDQLERPVLIRRRDTPMTLDQRVAFAHETNAQIGTGFSPAERAGADAAAITDEMAQLFRPDQSGNVLAASNDAFRRAFIGTIPATEQAALMTAEGQPTKQLADRITAAIFSKAYQDDRILALMAEEANPDVRNVINALTAAAPAFAQARAAGSDVDVTGPLLDAVQVIRETRARGQSLDELLNQQTMFGGIEPEVARMARFINSNIRSGKRMGEAFTDLGQALEKSAIQGRNASLFGGTGPLTLDTALEAANLRIGERAGPGSPQTALFSRAKGQDPTGECFHNSYRYIMAHQGEDLVLVHGWITGQGPIEGVRFEHSWVERRGDAFEAPGELTPQQIERFSRTAIDVTTEERYQDPIELPAPMYRGLANAKGVIEYTPAEMMQQAARNGHFGPWQLEADPISGNTSDAQGPVEDPLYSVGMVEGGTDIFTARQAKWTFDQVFRAATKNQAELVRVGHEIEEVMGPDVELVNNGMKQRGPTEAKMARKGYGAPGDLTDVVRAGFIADTSAEGFEIVDHLSSNFEVLDEGNGVYNEGYMDHKMLLRFADGQVGEIQVWSRAMARAKFGEGERLFQEARNLIKDRQVPDSALEEYEALQAAQRVLYTDALKASPGWLEEASSIAEAKGLTQVSHLLSQAGTVSADIISTTSNLTQAAPGEGITAPANEPSAVNPFTAGRPSSAPTSDTVMPSIITPESIPRAAPGYLTPEQVAIETRFAEQIAADFDGAVVAYDALPDSNGGQIMSVDTARELSADYNADRSQSQAVHEPGSWFIKRLFAQRLQEAPAPGQANKVLFTAGGTGAGKTSALRGTDLSSEAQLIYDGNLAGVASSKNKIDMAVSAGKEVDVVMVYRDPVDAFRGGVLPRAMRQGRTVPEHAHVRTHVESVNAVRELAQAYAGDDRVGFTLIDNSHGRGNSVVHDGIENMPVLDYTAIGARIHESLEQAYAAGEISEKVYQATLGRESGLGTEAPGQPQPQRQEQSSNELERALASLEPSIAALAPILSVRVVNTVAELPDPNAPPDVEGAYYQDGSVFLVRENLTPSRVREVFKHEMDHAAVENHEGAAKVLQQVQRATRAGNQVLRQLQREVLGRQGMLPPMTEAKEIMALATERGLKVPMVDNWNAAMRDLVRAAGMEADFTEADMIRFSTRAGKDLQRTAAMVRDFEAASQADPVVAKLNDPKATDSDLIAGLEALYEQTGPEIDQLSSRGPGRTLTNPEEVYSIHKENRQLREAVAQNSNIKTRAFMASLGFKGTRDEAQIVLDTAAQGRQVVDDSRPYAEQGISRDEALGRYGPKGINASVGNDPTMAYRSMSEAEYVATVRAGKGVASDGRWRAPQERTNFAEDFAGALGYQIGNRTDPRETGSPIYIVEAPRSALQPSQFDRGNFEGETTDTRRVWRVSPSEGQLVAEQVGEALYSRGGFPSAMELPGGRVTRGMTPAAYERGSHGGIDLNAPSVTVLKNPSHNELSRYVQDAQDGTLRWMQTKDGAYYFWDAFDAIHGDVFRGLAELEGLSIDNDFDEMMDKFVAPGEAFRASEDFITREDVMRGNLRGYETSDAFLGVEHSFASFLQSGHKAPSPRPLYSRHAAANPTLQGAMDALMAPPPDSLSMRDRVRGSVRGLIDIDGEAIVQGMVDGFHRLENIEREGFGAVLDAAESPTKAARATKNLASVMTAQMFYGPVDYRDGAFQLVDGRKGMIDIFEPLVAHKDGNLLHQWEFVALADRAQGYVDQGRFRSTEDINPMFTPQVMAEAEQLKAKYPIFQQVSDDWTTFNNTLLDLAVKQGVFKKDAIDRWQDNFYVPMYRAIEEVQGPGVRGGVEGHGGQQLQKRLKGGSETPYGNVFENMISNVAYLTDEIYKNSAMTRIVEMTAREGGPLEKLPMNWKPVRLEASVVEKAMGDAGMIIQDRRNIRPGEETTAKPFPGQEEWRSGMSAEEREQWLTFFERVAPAGRDVVTLYRNGKPEYYRVNDDLLLRSIQAMGYDSLLTSPIGRLFTGSKRLLTGAITLDPAFMMANWIRDTLSTWVVADAGSNKPIISAMKGMKDAFMNDKALFEIMAAGGGGSTIYDLQPGNLRNFLNDKLASKAKVDRFLGTVLHPKNFLRAWRKIGNAAENANRVAQFKAVRAAGGSVAEAAYQARDVLNFSRSGDFEGMRILFQTVPFMNARIQGLNRLYRGYQDNPGAFAMKGLMLASATMALMLLRNDGREEYEELDEWDKDAYWHLFLNSKDEPVGVGDHIRIPKPFEVGIIFGTIFERAYRGLSGRDPAKVVMHSAWRNIAETLAFNPIPQLVKPQIEQFANRTFFFNSPIVGLSEEGKLPEYQYTPWTSETMKQLANAMPNWLPGGMRSPKRLEAMLRAYTGATGTYALGVSDMMVRTAIGAPDRPSTPLHDLPVLRRFVRPPTARYTKYQSQLYDMLDEANDTFRSINALRREQKLKEASELVANSRGKLAARSRLNAIARQVTAINGRQKVIMFHPMMDADTKRERLEALGQQKNNILRRVGPLAELF